MLTSESLPRADWAMLGRRIMEAATMATAVSLEERHGLAELDQVCTGDQRHDELDET